MRNLVIPALALTLCAAAPARADSSRVWMSANVQAQLSGPWRLQSETVVRSTAWPRVYDAEQGVSIGHRFDKVFTFWLGYVYSPAHASGQVVFHEHRLREQLNVARIAMLGPVRLSGRARMETRWREETPGTGWRLRPQVRATLPLSRRLALNLSNESFLNLNTTRFQRDAGLERMRTALTLSLPIAGNMAVDAGYLEQHAFVRAGRDTDDHVAVVGLSANF